ncbi:S1 RNA-binding domain-containing protein [Streptococcus pneumoniae]|nr:S1 RNA-binding domain-containing protein [Streptococcus pneumoniae]
MILFENLFKPGQLHLAVDMLLTSSVLSAPQQCFEQPVASFLVCTLLFIEYKGKYSELK